MPQIARGGSSTQTARSERTPRHPTGIAPTRTRRRPRPQSVARAHLGPLGVVIACLVLAWGDLWMRFPQYKVLMGLAGWRPWPEDTYRGSVQNL
jgi:hypothetical protein